MEVPDIKPQKELEYKSRKLMQMFVKLNLEHPIVKVILEKTVKPTVKRELTEYVRKQCEVSLKIAYRVYCSRKLNIRRKRKSDASNENLPRWIVLRRSIVAYRLYK